jgi:hypothetical protein
MSQSTEYTLFSATHGTFSTMNHILGYKASLNKYKNIGIASYISSDHTGVKQEINNKRHYRKHSIV